MASGRSRDSAQDPEVLIAVLVLAAAVVVGGGALLARLNSRLHHATGPAAALSAAANTAGRVLVALLLASVALALLAITLRAFCTWRTLRSRVAYAVLPPPAFDPRPEAIEAFGQQLLGARRRVLAWLDRPACALRIQLTSTASGRLVYVLELPRRFRGTLFNAFATSYPGVELRPLAELEADPS
jgi:hypothetical protein